MVKRRRLSLAPPPEPVPDSRAKVVEELLGPAQPPIENMFLNVLGIDSAVELIDDHRYLMGRLAQALTMLLAQPVPAWNSCEELLAQALDDAQAYRRTRCARCPDEGICDQCRPHWDTASRYEWLSNELGLIGQVPRRPDLKSVGQ